MAANPTATVIGQGGTTITLVWNTASNASIAQKALSAITASVTGGQMQEVSYTGGSTLPALSNSSVTGVVLAEGAGAANHTPFQLSGQYQVAISNDTSATPAAQGVLVGLNAVGDEVFIGGGGGGVANFGINTQVYLAGQGPQSFVNQGFLGISSPSAQIWMDGNASVDGSSGAATVNIDNLIGPSAVGAPFGSELFLTNNGNGHNTVDLATSSSTVSGSVATPVIFLSGSGSVAATINAPGSAVSGAPSVTGAVEGQVWVVAGNSGGAAASINGGASQLVVFGGSAPLTVDGGTGKGDIGVFVGGKFQAGSGGGAIMAGAANEAVATTLMGGGNNDVFFGLSNNTTMIAGAGNEIMAGFAAAPGAASAGGTTFEGNLGAGASTTTMLMEIGAKNTFITGNGTDIITAITGSIGGAAAGNTFKEGVGSTVAGSLTNNATINGFNAAVDTISLSNPAGGPAYTTVAGTTASAGQIAVNVAGGSSTLKFGDGTTWTLVGANVTGGNFH